MSNVRFVNNSTSVKATLNAGYLRNITAATVILYRALQKMFTGTRTLRFDDNKKPIMYRVPGTKRKKYIPSAPGEPPAVRTGDLKKSYVYEIDQMVNNMRGRVGSDLKYALWLERGTSEIKPRPALQPALDDNIAEIRAALGKPIKGGK